MTSIERVLDPVCGMMIEPGSAAGTRLHRETLYHLCSIGCLRKFDRDADAYIAATGAEGYVAWQVAELPPWRPGAPRPEA